MPSGNRMKNHTSSDIRLSRLKVFIWDQTDLSTTCTWSARCESLFWSWSTDDWRDRYRNSSITISIIGKISPKLKGQQADWLVATGLAFTKQNKLDPWIKDQLKTILLFTVTKLGRAEGLFLPHVTTFRNNNDKIVDSRACFLWIHGSSRSHDSDVIMGAMASQTTSLTIVYSTVCSGAHQRKYQSSAPQAFVRGIHRWPVNSRTNSQ